MTAIFASAGGFATPIVSGRAVPPLARPHAGAVSADAPRTTAAADAILRAAGAVTTGEA